jgi:hypothetical protein
VSFSTDLAELVAGQLSRFITLNRHQLAGQVANFDFWLEQVRHALAAIDGYGVRFIRMQGAQELYVTAHNTTEFVLDVDQYTERPASPPHRVPDRDLQKARRALIATATQFLERCQRDELISESQLTKALESLGVKQNPR